MNHLKRKKLERMARRIVEMGEECRACLNVMSHASTGTKAHREAFVRSRDLKSWIRSMDQELNRERI